MDFRKVFFSGKIKIIVIVLSFCIIPFVLLKLHFPNKTASALIASSKKYTENDKSIIEKFGHINDETTMSYEIGIEAGTNKRIPDEARITLYVKGEKHEGYIKFFYKEKDSKWVFDKYETW